MKTGWMNGLIWGACFAAGVAGSARLSEEQRDGKAAEKTGGPAPVRTRERREEAAPAVDEQLKARVLAAVKEPERNEESLREMVRLLGQDPGLINAMWTEAGPNRQVLIGRLIRQLSDDAPDLMWRVLLRKNFELKSESVAWFELSRGIDWDPQGAWEVYRRVPDVFASFGPSLDAFAQSQGGAGKLFELADSGETVPEATLERAAATLEAAGMELPERAKELPKMKATLEYQAKYQAARDWLDRGAPAAGAESLDQTAVSFAVAGSKAVDPAWVTAVLAPEMAVAREGLLGGLAQRQDIGALTDAVRRAQEAGVDFSQGFIHYGPEMIYRQGTLHPEDALPLLELAKDPGDRRKWMEDYLTRWAKEDPNGVNACLPRIKDEDLRESIRAKVEAAAIR